MFDWDCWWSFRMATAAAEMEEMAMSTVAASAPYVSCWCPSHSMASNLCLVCQIRSLIACGMLVCGGDIGASQWMHCSRASWKVVCRWAHVVQGAPSQMPVRRIRGIALGSTVMAHLL